MAESQSLDWMRSETEGRVDLSKTPSLPLRQYEGLAGKTETELPLPTLCIGSTHWDRKAIKIALVG